MLYKRLEIDHFFLISNLFYFYLIILTKYMDKVLIFCLYLLIKCFDNFHIYIL